MITAFALCVTAGAQESLQLPSLDRPLAKTVREAKGLLVAELEQIEVEDFQMGRIAYSSRWKVIRVLRGTYPGEARLNVSVRGPHRERLPTIGLKYILITSDSSATHVACMLDYADQQMREIENLLAK